MLESDRPGATDLFSGARRAQRYDEGEGQPAAGPTADPPRDGPADTKSPMTQVHDGPDAVPSAPVGRGAESLRSTAVTAPTRPAAAEWGGRGRLNRGSGGLFRLSPRAAELAHREAVAVVRRATWTRAVNLLVASPKGGVGKTMASVILAGVLGQIRGGYVCAVESAESAGSLNQRAEGNPRRGLAELLAHVGDVQSAGHLGGYTAPQTSHADVIGTVGRRPVLTAADVLAVRQVLDTYYRITVTDTGNNPGHEAFQAALHTADAVVIPCPISIDALAAVEETLSVLTAAGGQVGAPDGLLSRVVVIVTHDGGPEDPDIDRDLRTRLAELPVAVVEVPFDSAIRLGGEISLSALNETSRRAWTAAVAVVVRALEAAPIEVNLVQLTCRVVTPTSSANQQN